MTEVYCDQEDCIYFNEANEKCLQEELWIEDFECTEYQKKAKTGKVET